MAAAAEVELAIIVDKKVTCLVNVLSLKKNAVAAVVEIDHATTVARKDI